VPGRPERSRERWAMFDTILIANRGEIACRVIETARAMGVRTVAVYSDADRDARHVALADRAVRIGTAAPADSYLRGERIVEVALETGAQGIHPGYGFLSENPDFVEAVEAAGLTFIGPSAEAIRAMGLKDAAKRLMEKAGVPVVPGYHGDKQDAEFLADRRVIFSDIERSFIGYSCFMTIAPLLFSRSFIVADGKRSIRRSFQKDELDPHLPDGWSVQRQFPFRLLAIYEGGNS